MALQSEEEWVGGDFVICKLITEDSVVGLGEAFVWLPETGVTPSQLITVIEKELYKYILGESPFDVERMKDRMDNNVARSEVSKGLLDIACYDLMGKLTGQPACNFMGGRVSGTIPNAVVIPLIAPESMLAFCKEFHNRGFRTFRLKLGRNINDDVANVSAVRKGLGDDARIRVDYNQAYLPVDAVKAINAIAPYGIDCVEQPVKSTDFIGMAYVQKRVDVPLMAHEGAFSLQDMTTLLELGAIGVMGINSERPGGVTKALKA
ncbi:MAG: hypothetical protein GY765_18520, partial [bacterium]|nr:hypothetical protein [bacterium]